MARTTRTEAVIELEEMFHGRMMECGNIVSLQDMIDYIVDVERNCGLTIDPQRIMIAYWRACDYVVDSYVANAYDTQAEDKSFDLNAEVKKWEARRPSTVRRNELLARFADFPAA